MISTAPIHDRRSTTIQGQLKEKERDKQREKRERDKIPVVEVEDALGMFEDEYGQYEGLEYDLEAFEEDTSSMFDVSARVYG